MYPTLIDCEHLSHHLAEPDWVVVDCRFDLLKPQAGQEAYALGHIPGAVYADLNQDLSSPVTAHSGRHPLPDPHDFAQQLGKWGIGNTSQVVVYDASNGGYAVRLWWMLRWLGHAAVALLDGGFAAWQAAELPVMAQIPTPITRQFIPAVHPDMNLTTVQIRDGMASHTITIVDARTSVRYAGEVEPIDPVAGHIPTALNYPYEGNCTAKGCFLPASQLKARFAALSDHPDRVVHMCGSGVTACHNLLAMEIAGLSGSKLYAGSWSEWVRDPTNPIIKGHAA